MSTAVSYRDPKRHSWLLSLLVPALLGCGPLAFLLLGSYWLLWLPLIVAYLAIPVLDYLVGEDRSNPPEQAVPALDADPFYRRITYALVPTLWLCIIFAAWFVARHALPWHAVLAVVLSTGVMGGFCINVGHELGHKRSVLEQRLAKLVLAPTGYGHFYVEHNRGHHRDVATPGDPASSRMGETIYAFVLREMPGAFRRAWLLEKTRAARQGKPSWHAGNEILQPLALTAALWLTLAVWLGPAILLFLVAASFWANFQLTSANYIEHYGLLRQPGPDGKPEPCRPHHSWNSNHALSNWVLFHLQRHADHHAHASRRYQCLRHFADLPTLPTGYFGMFVLAYFPALFFRVMNPRLIAASAADARRINFQPGLRDGLVARYRLRESATAQ
ncbi:alkane 1-monooxygenase [Massilia glaciei]|uniref:Alkane 1-monooxygenase n=1 Tax=Massilia glaciei TaxID=1524097 RepID=A0A2U2I6R2_9BURK|nr:alkane 1-monooxygenase [Massilia glaciei]PWF55427.1 alkane 1-monooxygenase [Massilia glaciei]